MALIPVGPTRAITSLSAANAAAQPGDVVELDAGTYFFGEGGVHWTVPNLTVRKATGAATRPVIDAQNNAIFGKGIWVVGANNFTCEDIELKNCRVLGSPDARSGIRHEADGLTCRRMYIHHCEDGILTSPSTTNDITLEFCEFSHCSVGGGDHNIYISHARTFTMRGCWSHDIGDNADAGEGHLVKSRAETNFILYNRLTGQDGFKSLCLDLPNGGLCYVIGNLIQQGRNSQGFTLLSYASFSDREANGGWNATPRELYVINNTFVNDLRVTDRHLIGSGGQGARFLFVESGASRLEMKNNLFCGGGTRTVFGGGGPTTVVDQNNLDVSQATLQDDLSYDYHLVADHPAIDAGVDPGTARGVSLTPTSEYSHPTAVVPRTTVRGLDIGAHEWTGVANPIRPPIAAGAWSTRPNSTIYPAKTSGQPGTGFGFDFGQGPIAYWAFSGAGYDTTRDRYGAVLAGGHAAYAGNEGYTIAGTDDSGQWVRTRTRSAPPAVANPDDTNNFGTSGTNLITMPDGRPGARHAYGAQCYMPSVDKWGIFGGYAQFNFPQNEHNFWWWDPAAADFLFKGQVPWGGNGISEITWAHPFRDRVVIHTIDQGEGAMFDYRPDLNAFAKLADGVPWIYVGTSQVDQRRGKLWIIDPVTAAVNVRDVRTGVGGPVAVTNAVGLNGGACMVWDNAFDAFAIWHPEQGANMWYLSPDVRAVVGITATGTIPPTAAQLNEGEDQPYTRLQRGNDGRYYFHPRADQLLHVYAPPITVDPNQPVIYAVSPASVQIGSAVDVTITGVQFAASVTVSAGTGITVSNVVRASATSITATFTSASDAALGARTVTVTNNVAALSGSKPNAFTITPLPQPPITAQHYAPDGTDRMTGFTAGANGIPDLRVDVQGIRTDVVTTEVRIRLLQGALGPGVWATPSTQFYQAWIEGVGLGLPAVLPAAITCYMEPAGMPPGPFEVTVTYANGGQTITTTTDPGSTLVRRQPVTGGTVTIT